MIEKLEKLLAEAKSAPWEWVPCAGGDFHVLAGPLHDPRYPSIDPAVVLDDGSACGEYGPSIDVEGADAKLIVALRNLAPELLQVVRAAKGANDNPYALSRALNALEAKLKEIDA